MRRFLADTRPLTNDDFRHLWVANIVTVIGAQLTVVAVPLQIYAITQSSAYVGLTGLFGLVPDLLPSAGAAERPGGALFLPGGIYQRLHP